MFQLLSQPVFCLPCHVLVPSHHLLWKQGFEWRFLDGNYFLVVFILFHVVIRFVKKAFLEYDSEVGCVILMSKNVFLQLFHTTVLLQNPIVTYLFNARNVVGYWRVIEIKWKARQNLIHYKIIKAASHHMLAWQRYVAHRLGFTHGCTMVR